MLGGHHEICGCAQILDPRLRGSALGALEELVDVSQAAQRGAQPTCRTNIAFAQQHGCNASNRQRMVRSRRNRGVAAGQRCITKVVTEGDPHHQLVDAGGPRVGLMVRVDPPPLAVRAIETPADARLIHPVGQEGQVGSVEPEPFLDRRGIKQLADTPQVEAARKHVEQSGHRVQYRVEGPCVAVDHRVAQGRNYATARLVPTLRRWAEHRTQHRRIQIKLWTHHRDVGLGQV